MELDKYLKHLRSSLQAADYSKLSPFEGTCTNDAEEEMLSRVDGSRRLILAELEADSESDLHVRGEVDALMQLIDNWVTSDDTSLHTLELVSYIHEDGSSSFTARRVDGGKWEFQSAPDIAEIDENKQRVELPDRIGPFKVGDKPMKSKVFAFEL